MKIKTQVIYDNMKTVVWTVVVGKDRNTTAASESETASTRLSVCRHGGSSCSRATPGRLELALHTCRFQRKPSMTLIRKIHMGS